MLLLIPSVIRQRCTELMLHAGGWLGCRDTQEEDGGGTHGHLTKGCPRDGQNEDEAMQMLFNYIHEFHEQNEFVQQ